MEKQALLSESDVDALEAEISDAVGRLGRCLVEEIKKTEQSIGRLVSDKVIISDLGQSIIKRLKEEAKDELRSEIENDIKEEVEPDIKEETYRKARDAMREVIWRVLQIKGMSVSDFTPIENWELDMIINEFAL